MDQSVNRNINNYNSPNINVAFPQLQDPFVSDPNLLASTTWPLSPLPPLPRPFLLHSPTSRYDPDTHLGPVSSNPPFPQLRSQLLFYSETSHQPPPTRLRPLQSNPPLPTDTTATRTVRKSFSRQNTPTAQRVPNFSLPFASQATPAPAAAAAAATAVATEGAATSPPPSQPSFFPAKASPTHRTGTGADKLLPNALNQPASIPPPRQHLTQSPTKAHIRKTASMMGTLKKVAGLARADEMEKGEGTEKEKQMRVGKKITKSRSIGLLKGAMMRRKRMEG